MRGRALRYAKKKIIKGMLTRSGHLLCHTIYYHFYLWHVFFFKLVECAHSQNVSNSLRSRKISFPEATFDLDLTQTAQEYIMAQ